MTAASMWPTSMDIGFPTGMMPIPASFLPSTLPPLPTTLPPLPSLTSAATLPPLLVEPLPDIRALKDELTKAENDTKDAARGGGAFVGVISMLSIQRGVGTVTCTDTKQAYSTEEIPIPREHVTGVMVGDTVLFRVQADGRGLPLVGFIRRIDSLTSQRQRILDLEVPEPTADAVESPQEYLGLVISFDAASGYGVLSCPSTKVIYGSDVFIHRASFMDLNVGDGVYFKMALNSLSLPCARHVRKAFGPDDGSSPPAGELPPLPSDNSSSPPPPPPGGMGGAAASDWSCPPPPPEDFSEKVKTLKHELDKAEATTKAAAKDGGAYVGIVSSLYGNQHAGTIECFEMPADAGGDVIVPNEWVSGLQVSDSVLFRVAPGDRTATLVKKVASLTEQRHHILDVEVPLPSPEASKIASHEYIGFVTSFSPSSGHGFLSCTTTQQAYGSDVYIHYKDFTGLACGDAVNFTVATNSRGKPVAITVRKAGNLAPPREDRSRSPRR